MAELIDLAGADQRRSLQHLLRRHQVGRPALIVGTPARRPPLLADGRLVARLRGRDDQESERQNHQTARKFSDMSAMRNLLLVRCGRREGNVGVPERTN